MKWHGVAFAVDMVIYSGLRNEYEESYLFNTINLFEHTTDIVNTSLLIV